MGILSGVFSYLFGLVINLMDVAISTFLGTLGFDLNTFEIYFPAAKDYYEVITGFAVGLLFMMLIFQIFRNFGVMLDMEAEDPLKMLGKTMLFFGMIIYSRSITDLITKLFVDPYSIFLNTYTATFEFSLLDLLSSLLSGMTTTFMSVVYMIMLIVLGWQFLKFVVEIVERYIVFYFVLYCAPVVFATGAFKSTAQIFQSWCRMLGSQSMLLLLNVWSIKLFISFLQVFNSASGDKIFYFLIGYAFLKFAQKADTLLRILGLNTASTGDMVRSLGSSIGGIAQAIRTAGGMAGKMFGGKGGNNSTNGSTNSGNVLSSSSGNTSGPMGSPSGGASANSQSMSSGITDTVTKSSKQNYANDVLACAKEQLAKSGQSSGADSATPMAVKATGQRKSEDLTLYQTMQGSKGGDVQNDDIPMQSENVINCHPKQEKVNAETMEGLANLAHGLPHNAYNSETRKHSGGEFTEFTGENANVIGASQLTPAEGFTQSHIKMPDGSNATMYKNSDTAQSHIVQFGSVDNGVIQGAISEVDQKTGKVGDAMAFKAVHENVPGAETFSTHTVPVADSQGGFYHVSTGADTSFFAAGGANSPSSSSVSSNIIPSGTNTMLGASTGHAAGASSDFVTGGTSVLRSANAKAPPILSNEMEDKAEILQTPNLVQSVNGISEAPPNNSPIMQAEDKPPIPPEVRRFSKNNPIYTGMFKREGGQIETFSRSDSTEPVQNMKKQRNDSI